MQNMEPVQSRSPKDSDPKPEIDNDPDNPANVTGQSLSPDPSLRRTGFDEFEEFLRGIDAETHARANALADDPNSGQSLSPDPSQPRTRSESFHETLAAIGDEELAAIDARLNDPDYVPSKVELR